MMMHRTASRRNHADKLSHLQRAHVLIDEKPERAITCFNNLTIAFADGAKWFGIPWCANDRSDSSLNIFVLGATYADGLYIRDTPASFIQVLNLVNTPRGNIYSGTRFHCVAV